MGFLISSPVSILNYKRAARAASTAPVALSGVSSLTIDTILLNHLDRVLLKNQANPNEFENGIYEVTMAGGNYSLARTSDANSSSSFKLNMAVAISEGAVNADKVFQINSDATIILGTTAITFSAIEPPAASLVPSQGTHNEKVLATDGLASYWAIEGVKTGYPAGTVVLGRAKPSGLASALNNTICGVGAGNGITSGVGNVVLGLQAGGVNNQGYGTGITTGSYNIVLGAYSGGTIHVSSETITTQSYCIAVGFAALTMGHNTIAIGYNSVAGNTNSIAIGNSASAGNHNYGGYSSNISIGTSSSSYDGHLSIAIGASAISRATESIAIGYNARTYGNYSVIAGAGSGGANLSGANNTVVGADSFNGAGLALAVGNTIIGKGIGKLITTGSGNLLAGVGSSAALTTGNYNTFLGQENSLTCTTGSENVAIGYYSNSTNSGNGLTTGSQNTYVGNRAAGANGTQGDAVSVGFSANAGAASVSVGKGCDSRGTYTVAIGTSVTGDGSDIYSVKIGYAVGNSSNPFGFYNGPTSGSRSVCIGAMTNGALQNVSYGANDDVVYIGYKAGGFSQGKSNEFFLDNQGRTTYAGQQTGSLMYGTFNATASSQTLAINAAVSTPYTLAVTGVATFTAAPVVSSVTASQILASGASKEVVSLSTATYPSLVELAYVKGVTSAVQTQFNLKADLISPVFTTPNIGSATGSISGNAATVTTNANLTGPVTSVGNATAIANSAISNAMLANAAVANLSGTNTGDMAFPFTGPNGSAAAPSYSFTNSTNSGMYQNSGTFLCYNGGNGLSVSANDVYIYKNLSLQATLYAGGSFLGNTVLSGYLYWGSDLTGYAGTAGLLGRGWTGVLYRPHRLDVAQKITVGKRISGSQLYGATLSVCGTDALTSSSVTTNNPNNSTTIIANNGDPSGANIDVGDIISLSGESPSRQARITALTISYPNVTYTVDSALGDGTNRTVVYEEHIASFRKSDGTEVLLVAKDGAITINSTLKIKEGSNARMGVATLVTGTVTVSNTSVTANTRIMLTAQNNGGTIGWLSVSARTASTSFTILSSSPTDTSDVAWMLVEPA